MSDDSASWSPDGTTILLVDVEGLGPNPHPYLMDANGSNLRPLISDDIFDDPEWLVTDVAWSPDGHDIMIDVLSVPELQAGAPTLHVVRVSDGLVTPIPTASFSVLVDLAWMPEAPEVAPLPDEDLDAV